MNKPKIIGRSSSHFTRITRIFADELNIEYDFEVVSNLASLDSIDYGGNPALKLPSLLTDKGLWFGSLPIVRELLRISSTEKKIVLPENLDNPLTSNMQELITSAMNTEVNLIMSKIGVSAEDSMYQKKMFQSLNNILEWMDANLSEVFSILPNNYDLSFLEVSLFCFIEHLEFREVLSVAPYKELNVFRSKFSERQLAKNTVYHYD